MLELMSAVAIGVAIGAFVGWSAAGRKARRHQAGDAAQAQSIAAGQALLVAAQRQELAGWLARLQAAEKEAQTHGETATGAAGWAQQLATTTQAAQDVVALSQEIGRQVAGLAESMGQTSLAIDEMTFGSVEVAQNIEALSRACEETAASMTDMNKSIGAVEAHANEASRISAQVHTDAETGAAALHQTVAGIERIRAGNRLATDVIRDLDHKISAVGKILEVIDDVAEQTNLLALNAAIIAAQAGEQGRGFAVVADEIKALAERTGASTKEIAELISTMQQQSRRATESMAQGLVNVEEGVQLGHNAGDALQKIVASAKRSTAMTQSIALATVEQTQRSTQVNDAIGRVAQTVQQMAFATAEQAKGAQHLNVSTGQMREVMVSAQQNAEVQGSTGADVGAFLTALPGTMTQLQAQLHDCRQMHRALASEVSAALDALTRDAAPPAG